MAEWTAKYGGVFRIRMLSKWAVIVTDPTLVRAVLQASKTYVPKDGRLYAPIEAASHPRCPNILSSSDAGANGSDGRYWAAVRGAWMKCFTSTNLKRVLPTVVSLCERIIKQQVVAAAASQPTAAAAAAADGNAGAAAAAGPAGWSSVNLCQITDRITLDVIGEVAYGRDVGAVSQKRSRYLELVSGMLAVMHEEMSHPMLRLLRQLRPDKAKAQLAREWNEANAAEVRAAMADPPGEHTIAGQLLQVLDPATGTPLTLNQLKAELVIAALAGFETTSMALSWTLGALACHPAALHKLEQELDSAGLLATAANPQPSPFTWQLLGKLQFLQAVIREGLRLFSPAANGSFRMNIAGDLQLREGLVIPKDTIVGVPFFAFGHNPETYGPDVEAFRPERWLVGRSSSSSSSSRNGFSSSGGSMDGAAYSSMDGGSASLSSIDAQAADTDAIGSSSAANGTAPAAAAAAAAAGGKGSRQQPPNDPWSFSIGPRDCAGQALARIELQVVIAMLVGQLQLQLHPSVGGWQGLLQRRMYHTTLQVEGGLPMLLRPRVP
uniref:Cytochrome P450 n=1 Tax=Tetradesmus obliquus TaxID=3088 RepID=A0A383VZN8_TETOB|eukprot:jgi/Sobl393_1/17750/SZX63132.1